MKKTLLFVLVIVMLLGSLAACSSNQTPEASTDATAEPTAVASAVASTEVVAEPAGKPVSELKIGALGTFVKNDGGWNQAQYQGLVDALKTLGIPEENLIFVENTAEEVTAVTSAVDALATSGVDIIVGASTGYAPILSQLAPEYPNIMFAQVGDKVDNLIGYQIRDYQAMFLLGATSALVSDNNMLGYAAGMSEASVRRGINAFALGAKYIEPEDQVQVVWAGSWYDLDKETQSAKSLINMGIDCIGINASSPAIPQTCQEAGVYCTGYHLDMHEYAPDAVMVSFMWNWAPIFEQIMQTVADGTATTDDFYFWGSDKNCATISAFNDAIVSKEIQAQVLEIQTKINSGELEVYAGELKDNEGNVIVPADSVMSDQDISAQKFLVENVIGTWQ